MQCGQTQSGGPDLSTGDVDHRPNATLIEMRSPLSSADLLHARAVASLDRQGLVEAARTSVGIGFRAGRGVVLDSHVLVKRRQYFGRHPPITAPIRQ